MYSRLIRSTLASAHTVSRVASAGSHAQCVAKRVPGVNAVASVARFSTTGQRKEEAAGVSVLWHDKSMNSIRHAY